MTKTSVTWRKEKGTVLVLSSLERGQYIPPRVPSSGRGDGGRGGQCGILRKISCIELLLQLEQKTKAGNKSGKVHCETLIS